MSDLSRREFSRVVVGSAGMALISPLVSRATASPGQGQAARGSITDVPGIKVGHFTDPRSPTGSTVFIFEETATVGVDYDGSALASYQVVMLQPVSPIQKITGIILTGGASFGLAAATGVVRYLEEHKIGHVTSTGVVYPLVVGSVIWDLEVGNNSKIRPDAEAGYKACQAASARPVEEGNVGVGAGATTGKMLASQGIGGMKTGVGTASLRAGDVVIAALAAVNAVGDIVDWRTGRIMAGARRPDGKGFANIVETIRANLSAKTPRSSVNFNDPVLESTTIVVVATNVDFNKTELTKLAMMASTGAARTINPYHTTGDGDCAYAVSTNKLKADVPLSMIGALAAEVVSEAVLQSAKMASSVPGWPAYRDYTAKLP